MLILATLIVYRLATDLAWESGPFRLYGAMRGYVMLHAGADNWLSEGIVCPICWSFWIALPAGLLLDLSVMGLVYWLAIAGAVALLVRMTP
jgi:hypothetical protein